MDNPRHLTSEMMEQLIKDKLPHQTAAACRAHLAGCAPCRWALDDLRVFSSAWTTWEAGAHGRSFAECPREIRTKLVDATIAIFKDPILSNLTPLQRKRLEKWRTSAPAADDPQPATADSDTEFTLLAAAPAFVGAVKGEVGTAFGVGVDEETGRGALIKVTAHVGDKRFDAGRLTLVGAQVEGQRHKGVEYQLTPPLSLLKMKLIKRFDTIPSLAALQLGKREVHVEIDLPQHLSHADSLLLAVIVAVARAATGSEAGQRQVYSADVGLDGALRAVGRLEEKARIVLAAEGFQWVIARESLGGIDPGTRAKASDQIVAFDHVTPLFRHLEIPETDESESVTSSADTPKPHSRFGWLAAAAGLAGIGAAGALVLAAGRLSVLGDLLMAWHLSQPAGDVPGLVQPFKTVLLVCLALGLLAAMLSWPGRKTSRTGFSPGWLAGGAFFILIACLAAGLHQFTTTADRIEDDFTRYERIEYLNTIPLFSSVTAGLPDYRYRAFMQQAGSSDPTRIRTAVEIGLGTNPSLPAFGDTFVQVVVLLMDRLTDADLAARALDSYITYVEAIGPKPGARQHVADTLTAAEDLITRYRLESASHDGISYGEHLREISNKYQL